MKGCIEGDQKGTCFRCGKVGQTERHHIFAGPNRKHSEKYGLTVYLCHACHNEPPYGAHFSKKTADWLHRIGQRTFETNAEKRGIQEPRKEFVKIFGKNYL